MPTPPERRFGNYQVVRQIGEGGFAEVYEAENPLLQRRAAIKVLHAQLNKDPALVRRFLNEARAASAIHHPNIIEVFDAGITPEGQPYILMEFLDGESLQRFIAARGRLPLPTILEITRQACSALAAAHTAGIVHRDLKPENLFVLPDSASPHGILVKVLDFGIAKIKHKGSKGTTQTRAGLIMGSPAYMSPEQCRDSSDVDHRTDIYSMGIIVYEMLAGVPPFISESATEMMILQMSAAPSALPLQLPDVPEYVERAVMRSLAKDRAARFDSIVDFIGALFGSSPAITDSRPPSAAEEASGEVRDIAGVREASSRPRSVAASDSRFALNPPSASAGIASNFPRGPSRPPWNSSVPVGTTLAGATGERVAEADDQTTETETVRPRRRFWPLAVGAGVVALASALGIVMVKRPASTGRPPIPAKTDTVTDTTERPRMETVRLRVQSAPAGATVVNDRDGTELGQTPIEKVVPQGQGSLGLTLRMAGFKDESVSLGLNEDSSVLVHLKASIPEGTGGPRGKGRERHGPGQIQKTPAPKQSTETEGKSAARPARGEGGDFYGWKGH